MLFRSRLKGAGKATPPNAIQWPKLLPSSRQEQTPISLASIHCPPYSIYTPTPCVLVAYVSSSLGPIPRNISFARSFHQSRTDQVFDCRKEGSSPVFRWARKTDLKIMSSHSDQHASGLRVGYNDGMIGSGSFSLCHRPRRSPRHQGDIRWKRSRCSLYATSGCKSA